MNPKLFIAIVAIFGTGLIAGYFANRLWDQAHQASAEDASRQIREIGDYRFINPLLECDVSQGRIDAHKQNFRSLLESHTTLVKKEYQLAEVAVYFRDLNNGPTFGIDESGEFFPASLLKVPVMMAYYRWSEEETDLLERRVLYERPVDFGVSVTIKPRIELVPGQEYLVGQLIEHMILYSDNQALYLLAQRLPQERIIELFRIIGIGDDVIKDRQAKLTVKEYAGLFRILFNSSYLSRDNSEKALELLSRTDYHDALPGRLPQGIAVAHKFGEAGTGETERQLHDCGIAYFPDHPYLACIMTRGRDVEKLKLGIQDISRFIYDQVDEQY